VTARTHITFAEFIFLLILTTTGVALNLRNAFGSTSHSCSLRMTQLVFHFL